MNNEQNKKSMLVPLIGVLLVVLVLGLVGYVIFTKTIKPVKPNFLVITNPCSDSVPSEPITIEITSKGLAQPNALVCHGQGVRWINKDAKSSYSLTSTSQSPDALRYRDFSAIQSGEEVTVYFESPETIPYEVVSTHSRFLGTITVR